MRDAVLTGLLAFFGAFLGVPTASAAQAFVVRRAFERARRSLVSPGQAPTTAHDDTPTPNERGGL